MEIIYIERQNGGAREPLVHLRWLVRVPANEMMASLEAPERRLGALGWERYYEERAVVHLHRCNGGLDLISLPHDFFHFFSTASLHHRRYSPALL
ncbi:hypothetical protein GUJ93_ZPchr0002g25389 [Zizania palustris]|uniref:Uncharacterized protein n=1 Tax=Zizania palustris TaxID=103762 RepID=A0A8J5SDK4_ZIZPA|nr:hypothetical protein GUJ93_ZPchr0002g25389 [Zizania palustris]